MRIGIYVDVARDERPTGIGKHVVHLLRALAQIDRKNDYWLYYPIPAFGRDAGFAHRPDQANFRSRPVRFPQNWASEHPSVWWKWRLPRVLRRDGVDIFHGPNHFAPKFDRGRTVVTIHDLAFFRMEVHGPKLDAVFQHWARLALNWSGMVIALSNNTLRDVVNLGVDPDRVRVIYGGGSVLAEHEIAYDRREELRESLGLPEKFILFVGALQPRKNVPFLLKGFAELKSRCPALPHSLVLAGPKDSATEQISQEARRLGIERHVLMTGYLEDWQLPLLYKLADLFVLPTLYEGFTLVTVEAMSYGTPLVATDSSSIKEGVGDAGLLVPVDDVCALADAMQRGLMDSGLRQRLINLGKQQAQRFTWERCAEQTLALYEDVFKRTGNGIGS